MNTINVQIPTDFSKQFATYIIAYTPEYNAWFITNERYFFYEDCVEFKTQNDAYIWFIKNLYSYWQIQNDINRRIGQYNRVYDVPQITILGIGVLSVYVYGY